MEPIYLDYNATGPVAPEVLGGASVRVGDDLYDGTIRRRLHETRTALVGKK